MKKTALLAAAAAAALLPAQAQAADLELVLALDESGSLSAAQFDLQRNAYINVLQDPSIIPLNGTLAIGIYKFDGGVQQIFPITEIANAGTIAAMVAALQAIVFNGGSTNIAGAITAATTEIFGNAINSTRQVIDVSTDGQNNVGNLNAARTAALAAGVDQINCIGIGQFADCSGVVGGTGSFSINASNFNDFEASLRTKLRREINPVPEPATWLTMILGFFGLGGALRLKRRRRSLSLSAI